MSTAASPTPSPSPSPSVTTALLPTPGPRSTTPLSGLDVVGHGIYLRPHGPYELRGVLFPRKDPTIVSMRDAALSYELPAGYDVDESPPLPAGQLLNQVKIEESWDRFNKQLSLDANVAGGNGSFGVSATNAQQMRADEDAYYAVRTSFIPLFSVYLADQGNYLPELDQAELPVPFKFSNRRAYEAFFQRFGSHYVKRAWLGGKASLLFTVLKSSSLTKQDIQAGIKASMMGVSAQANAQLSASRERLLSNSQCSVSGRGGDELKLASLTSLDENVYNQWVASVRDNPQAIELEVAGIWTLLKDPDRAATLAEAYRALNVFSGLNAAFTVDKTVYIVRGRKYFSYHMELGESEKPRLLVERWIDLGAVGLDRIDAAFSGPYLTFASGEDLRRKVHVFYRDSYARIDMDTDHLDFGPVPFTEAWPGLQFPRIDTALALDRDTVYFFCGNQYVRFNTRTMRVDPGYPQLISRRWKGVTFDRLDAALYWSNGKVYFFRDDQYIRYDIVTYRADPGYPRAILGDYVEDWKFFD